MVLKTRHGWGYRTLMGEVSDSIHLRRFCRIALCDRVPDESTVRKLTKRIGCETVDEVSRVLIETAVREQRFRARAVRIDSTVIEADVKYPTDAGLASHGVRALAAEGRKLAAKVAQPKTRVRDRSRSMGRRLRAISRTIRRRSGQAKSEVLALTEQTGQLLRQSVREARRLAQTARKRARGRGAQAKLTAAARLDDLADRCEKVVEQITQRVAGEPISDRLISLADPDARPIRKGKLGKPNEFGYVAQIAEVTEHTRRGARADRPGRQPDRQHARGHAVAPHRRRAAPGGPGAARGGPGRRLHPGRDHPDAQRAGARAGVHLRPPTTRLAAHSTPLAALPHRSRRSHQPPQERLRAAAQPPEGP